MNPNRHLIFQHRRGLCALFASIALAGSAHALTTNLLIRFEGSLDGTVYTLGAGEIDATGTFSANGNPLVKGGRAELFGSAQSDVFADGFRFDPAALEPLADTHWVAEAVVAFDTPGGGLSTVIDVQGDTDFRFSHDSRALEAGYWDGATNYRMQAVLPKSRHFIHLALVWEADARRLTAYTNGIPIGCVGDRPFVAAGPVSFGYFARAGIAGRGIDGVLYAVSFATSGRPIQPSDFLVNRMPPPPPPSAPVDPRFPSERGATPPEQWARWLPTRIRQLDAERSQLLENISALPQHRPVFLSNRLGYHSRLDEAETDETDPPNRIQFSWEWDPLLDSIALVPAFNPKAAETYAFPKRFKIEVRPIDTDVFETVVDWMDEDFPDPGLYPVFFAGIGRRVTQVCITVPQMLHESGMAYSALGEIYLMRQRPDGSTGANMAAWGPGHVAVEASDSFSMPPLWDLDYLHDERVGLGFPLSDETVAVPDLMVVFEEGDAPDDVQLVLDLGRVQPIGRIEFWPAAPPAGLALPSFGFPGEIGVELSATADFAEKEELWTASDGGNRHRENLLSVAARAYRARYLRVTMRELAEHKGKRILGLGEIRVTEFDEDLSAGCRITARGIPEEQLDQLPLLVDGCSGQRRILPVGEWIKGLAQRRPLDRRLAVVDRELVLARAGWWSMKQRLGIWGSGSVVLVLMGGLVAQRQMRRRSLNRLKWRITRDLHDEVGSSLGSISLTAEQLENMTTDEVMQEELDDLSLMAREACVSLREVVWVSDRKTIHLPELVDKLIERATRVLHGSMELSVERAETYPLQEVSLPFKRHLIMLFKEAVHNCVRHAQATKVHMAFVVAGDGLRISIRDNGCGFDTEKATDGCGMDNMKERAREMGGIVKIASNPGEGTSIVLDVPLRALTNRADHHYKTSN